ncbi:hypothetical protein D3C86_1960270 [compost metagenome]
MRSNVNQRCVRQASARGKMLPFLWCQSVSSTEIALPIASSMSKRLERSTPVSIQSRKNWACFLCSSLSDAAVTVIGNCETERRRVASCAR